MTDREKVINGLRCLSGYNEMVENPCADCGYADCPTYANCVAEVARDALELLKERENHVSVPFTWLVKFCTHIDFREPMSDEERAERWKEKLNQQFGVKFDGMKVKWDE